MWKPGGAARAQAAKQVIEKVMPGEPISWADLFAISGAVRPGPGPAPPAGSERACDVHQAQTESRPGPLARCLTRARSCLAHDQTLCMRRCCAAQCPVRSYFL
jgi:hypothetical protein